MSVQTHATHRPARDLFAHVRAIGPRPVPAGIHEHTVSREEAFVALRRMVAQADLPFSVDTMPPNLYTLRGTTIFSNRQLDGVSFPVSDDLPKSLATAKGVFFVSLQATATGMRLIYVDTQEGRNVVRDELVSSTVAHLA